MANLMTGGFGGELHNPQFAYGKQPTINPDKSESSMVKEPTGDMWVFTYTPTTIPVDNAEVSPYGVVYDDRFSGIFDVDINVDNDELSDWNGIFDAEEIL